MSASHPEIMFWLVLIAMDAWILVRTAGQVAEIKNGFEEALAATVQKELPRMWKANTNFRFTFCTFGVLAAIGLALMYLISTDWAVYLCPIFNLNRTGGHFLLVGRTCLDLL